MPTTMSPKPNSSSNLTYSQSDIFRGGASVLKPSHITRYEYTCTLHLPLSSLRLQRPVNASQCSRPQRRGDFGPDRSIFLTITRAYRDLLTKDDFVHMSSQELEVDLQHKNPLGRAMTRLTKYPGNTLLQSGKFQMQMKGEMNFVIKRITSIPLSNGGFGKEVEVYEIPCKEWRDLRPPSSPGHDSWWLRLHDLYSGVTDRAVWRTRKTIDKCRIAAPLTEWYVRFRLRFHLTCVLLIRHMRPKYWLYFDGLRSFFFEILQEQLFRVSLMKERLPRPGVEKAVTVYREKRHISDSDYESCCLLCSRTWYDDSEYACKLKCGHWCCLECVTALVDEAGTCIPPFLLLISATDHISLRQAYSR